PPRRSGCPPRWLRPARWSSGPTGRRRTRAPGPRKADPPRQGGAERPKRDRLFRGPRQRLRDQPATVGDAVERDEAAHARALGGAEQNFIERPEPVAQALELMRLADLVDLGLDG